MQVFADPTELRESSTLPEDVAGVAIPLPGLEERTGADLLVSILDIPVASDMLLQRHCDYGALIQLKRLGDLQSSITDSRLFYDIMKMREWSPFPWLVVSGVLLHSTGKAINGKVESVRPMVGNMMNFTVTGRTGLGYSAIDAALDAYAYYGGYIKQLPDDALLLPWLKRQAKALQEIQDGKITELMPRSKWRDITGPTKVAWLASLFDGIGQKTAEAVFDKIAELTGNTDPTLYQAVAFVTDYNAATIPGITRERISGWREFLGLHAGEETHLTPALYATLGIEWRLFDTGEVYWHGPAMSHHYRNDGAIRPEGVNTPYYFRDLLRDGPFTLTYLAEDEEQTITGELLYVHFEKKFEYIYVNGPDDVVPIRLDLITKVDRTKGD